MALKQSEKMIGLTSHKVNFTQPSTKTVTPGAPLTVPNAEPADYTYTQTIESGDVVTVDHPVPFLFSIYNYCNGINLTGSSQTLNYRILLNDSSVATGSFAVAAGQYYSINFWSTTFGNVDVGDVIKVRLWAADSSYFDCKFYGFRIFATDVALVAPGEIAYNVNYVSGGSLAFSGISAGNNSSYILFSTTNMATNNSVTPSGSNAMAHALLNLEGQTYANVRIPANKTYPTSVSTSVGAAPSCWSIGVFDAMRWDD